MAHAITINTTGNALGQYCVRYGNQIHQTIRQGLEIESLLPKVSCDHTYQGQDVDISDILQPYQKGFTPNNTETFGGVKNTLQLAKIDLEFDWLQMESFFDKWKCNWFEAGKPEQDWTYPKYIMNQVVLPKVIEEINLNSWKGEYVAPTAGTPGGYLTTFTGFKKHIEDLITATSLTPITTGALVATTMVAQVRTFCEGLPLLYKYKSGKILMSKTNAQRYADDYQTKYPSRKVTEDTPDKLYLRVDHFNKTIIGIDAMEGSDRFVCIFDNMDSLIVGTRRGMPTMPNFRVHVEDRSLHVLTEFYRFYGFETLKHVFVNEQA